MRLECRTHKNGLWACTCSSDDAWKSREFHLNPFISSPQWKVPFHCSRLCCAGCAIDQFLTLLSLIWNRLLDSHGAPRSEEEAAEMWKACWASFHFRGQRKTLSENWIGLHRYRSPKNREAKEKVSFGLEIIKLNSQPYVVLSAIHFNGECLGIIAP